MNTNIPVVFLGMGLVVGTVGLLAAGCDDDDDGGGNDAVALGVGAECTVDGDCDDGQKCLDFKGGYCGLEDCTLDGDCPSGSACVTHTDGINYCFLVCDNKADCNPHRPPDAEANCVSSIVFADPDTTANKACEPPSSSGAGGTGGAISGSGAGGAGGV